MKAPSTYIREFAKLNENINDTMQSHLITDIKKFGIFEDDYDLFIKQRADKVLKILRKWLPVQS